MLKKLIIYFVVLPITILVYTILALCCGIIGFFRAIDEYHKEVKPSINKFVELLKW